MLAGADVVIDALFGAGLSRPLDGAAAEVVAAINASGKPVLAVDVPSGLDGTTGVRTGAGGAGDAHGDVLSHETGTPAAAGQVALRRGGGCRHRLFQQSVLDEVAPRTFANGPSLWLGVFPKPRLDGHKYTRGHAVVVSGPAESTGAARLGARGALRIGAGLVTLVGSGAATAINATQCTAVMVRALASDGELAEFLADERRNAVLIGPGAGVGAATAASVLTVLGSAAAAVLDADALTSFVADDEDAPVKAAGLGFVVRSADPEPVKDGLFEAIKARQAPVVVTPHEGEFKRLFGDLAGSKLERARRAAELSGAVVILKGPDTVIAAPDGRAAINDNAPPWLATAGSGDVLAGFVTGLLAQRMPAFEAACAAVWLHGECANRFGIGLIAEDLPEQLPRVLTAMHGAPSIHLSSRP